MARDVSAFNLVCGEYADHSIDRAIQRKQFTSKDAELVRTFTSESAGHRGDLYLPVEQDHLYPRRMAPIYF